MAASVRKKESFTVVEFEDQGQDFLTWHINEATGLVAKVEPCQEWLWKGKLVDDLRGLAVGGRVTYHTAEGVRFIKYPITRVSRGQPLSVRKLPDASAALTLSAGSEQQ